MPIFNLCRICLTEDANPKAMQPLFDTKNSRCAELVQQIEQCGGIVLKVQDEFPKMICSQCLEYLETSCKFRALCQASENSLLNIIVKAELKTEPLECGTPLTDALGDDADNDLYFTEFIDAEEVDMSELTADKRETHTDTDDDNCIDGVGDFSGQTLTEAPAPNDEFDDEDWVEKQSKKKITRKGSSNKKKCRALGKSKKRGRPSACTKLTTTISSIDVKPKKERERKKVDITPSSIMCEICGNIYTKQSLLNLHMRRHMAEKPFECEICLKSFACPSEIRRHMRVHTGEKPYVCKFCGRTFADRSTNIKHERIHTNERPFTCNTCGKSFTYSNVLKNHMLTHTGEKPFPCRPCNKTFSRKHQLDQHCATLTHQQTVKNLNAEALDIKENTANECAVKHEADNIDVKVTVKTYLSEHSAQPLIC